MVEGRSDINGCSPWESLQFQTQQVYCVRNADGSIKEGGKVNALSFIYHILHMCNAKIFFLFLFGRPHVQLIGMSYIHSFIAIVYVLSI